MLLNCKFNCYLIVEIMAKLYSQKLIVKKKFEFVNPLKIRHKKRKTCTSDVFTG